MNLRRYADAMALLAGCKMGYGAGGCFDGVRTLDWRSQRHTWSQSMCHDDDELAEMARCASRVVNTIW